MLSPQPMPCREVSVSPQQICEQARNWHEPVVMRQCLHQWPLVQAGKESEQALRHYLAQFYNNHSLVFYSGKTEDHFDVGFNPAMSGFTFERETGCLADVFARLNANPRRGCYVGSTPTALALPGIERDNNIDFAPFKPLINFWLGNQSRVMAHYDSPSNVACCVAGSREFLLFPPEQIENLYVGPVDLTPSGRPVSMTAIDAQAVKARPQLKQALEYAQLAALAPGDALYIPPLWWHQVTSKSQLNMLVNYWWRFTSEYLGSPDLALEYAILALRGLPESQRKAWQSLFDYYIFSDREKAEKAIPKALRGILNSTDERAIRSGWMKFSKKLHS